jgi:predicted Fe-S protein YdhL (DUF1289 family)
MASNTTEVPSPCIQVCRIDPASGLCQGCLRSLDEIAAWPNLSARDKRLVLDRVATRGERSVVLS